MVVYQIGCGDGHRFEGWFRAADDFKSQLASGQLTCPYCASGELHLSTEPAALIAKRQPEMPAENPELDIRIKLENLPDELFLKGQQVVIDSRALARIVQDV